MEEERDFKNIQVNKYQTEITEELLSQYPKEVQKDFWDFVMSVPFIKNLISPNRQYAKDRPRDSQGRIIVDLANPHILENMDYFRPAALKYMKDGRYTDLKPNRNPNSPYGRWIREEIRRCWEGYVRPSDGEWVTGYMYFYLNYVPMMVTKADKDSNKRRASRIEGFPDVWEATYWRFHYIDQARNGGMYNKFEGGNHCVELSKRGSGKAHPYETPIFTPQGVRQWGDLQIGDYVYGDDGKPTQIVDIPFDGIAPIYKLTLKDGRTVEASEGHLWKVYRHNKGVQVLSTKELLEIYKGKRKVSYRNPLGVEYTCGIVRNEGIEMPHQNVGIDPYTLGLLLGDGCFCTPKANNTLYYTCQDSDAEFIIPLIPYETKKRKNKYAYSIVIPDGAKYLDTLGLWMHKSEDKFIPEAYLYNSKEVRKELLMGLIDSDGYITNSKHPMNGYDISVSSRKFAEDIMWLCRSLGYNVILHSKQPWYYNKNKEKIQGLTSYRVSIYTDDTLSHLPRKRNICSLSTYSRSKQISTRIVNIEYVGKKKAKCITVDNVSHCYLIGDFITTHNSFSLAAIMAHNLLLGENEEAHKRTTTILTAYLREYLADKDGTLSKFTPIKSFLAEHTQFPRRMLTDSPNRMSWKSGYKDKFTGADMGDQNILLGLSSKDDVSKIRGKRGYILFEEFGSFPNLIDIYNNVRDGMKEGAYVYGLAYLVGTSGDSDSDFHGAQELVYNPKGYDVYALPNNWDRPNQGRPWFAFFTPAYVNLKGYYNKDGVSDVVLGLLHVLSGRYRAKYETSDPRTIIKVVSNMPITPSEAIIQSGISQFPVTDIESRLMEINSNPNFYDTTYVGQLTIVENQVKFVPTSDVPIRFFPHKDNKNMAGALEIYEMPQKDANGDVYENRYIAGADPYDNDESTTVSLGSILVLDLMTDRIVAEYTGRPPMADDYFEICRRLCLFYNARLNYENNKKGLFAHFSRMNSTYLLTDVLEILVDKQMMKPGGVGNTAHPYSQLVRTPNGIKKWGDIKIGDTLYNDYGGITTVTAIPFDGIAPVYEITLNDGRKVKASNNHLWRVYDWGGRQKIISTEDILKKYYRTKTVKGKEYKEYKYYIPANEGIEYPVRDIPLPAYFMGLMLGDGCFTQSKCHQAYFISTPDDMKEYMSILGYDYHTMDDRHHRIKIKNVENIFNELGLKDKKSATKFIPDLYKYNSRQIRLELLKGLMDTDGTIDSKNAYISYTTVSRQLAEDVLELVRSLGINCKLNVFTNDYGPIYLISIYATYPVFNLERKKSRQRITKNRGYKTAICNIEYIGSEMAKCVQVDSKNSCYLIGDFITTHNSKGTNASNSINGWARQLSAKYLLTPTVTIIAEDGEEKEITTYNLNLIKNKALLLELSQWNPYGNFDRVSALGMLMLLREDRLRLMGGRYDGKENEIDNDDVLNDSYWADNYHWDSKETLFDDNVLESLSAVV